jgi:hypothetical protein
MSFRTLLDSLCKDTLHALQIGLHLPQMIGCQRACLSARPVRAVGEPQQGRNLVKREPQLAAASDEDQAPEVLILVDPVPAFRAPGRRDQALVLIKADGLDVDAGTSRQHAYGQSTRCSRFRERAHAKNRLNL